MKGVALSLSGLLALGAMLFAFTPLAHAESVLWNTTISGGVGVAACGSTNVWCGTAIGFNNPNITVQYRASVFDADTGAVIPVGAKVPLGARLKFVFDTHTSEDIYWFATGASFDSPYGDWGTAAPTLACRDKDFVGSYSNAYAHGGQFRIYSTLLGAPPTQTLQGIDGGQLNCGSFDGKSVICVAAHAGAVPAVFNFAGTQGSFYGRWYWADPTGMGYGTYPGYARGAGANVCEGTNDQMLIEPGHAWTGSWTDLTAWTDFSSKKDANSSTSFQIAPQTISYPLTVVSGCDTTNSTQTTNTTAATDKPAYWLDTAPKVGGYSQGAHVSGDVTKQLDADTASITAYMYCRVGNNGARMDNAQFTVKDKSGTSVFESAKIACGNISNSYFGTTGLCGTGGSAHDCYDGTYNIDLPTAGAPYSVHTWGSGQNGYAADNYIFDAYLQVTEHKTSKFQTNANTTNGGTNSCTPVGPNAPSLTSVGQCVIGTPHAISMVADDLNADPIRYGVDWDADGSVDEWIPGSSYVPSGTPQTANRTYSIAGSKTLKVLAQDKNGLNSDWASLTFNCAASATAGLEGNNDNGGNGAGNFLNLPDIDLRVIPSLVHQGDTTKVNWSSTNVQSCVVQGQNGDSWTSLLSPVGGQTSKPITGQTTYTLTCIDLSGVSLSKQATVTVIPKFQEK